LLLLLTVVSIRTNPFALAGLAAGLPVGAILGRIAIGKTRFEQVGGEFFFTPHAPIGLAVALLFMGRMAWRAYEFYALGSFAHHEFVSSPLTLVIFGVLAGYYMSYAFGLLSWRKRTASVSP
jgi:cytochrome b561